MAIAPSDSAKELWLRAYPWMYNNIRVIYHQKLLGAYINNMQMIEKRKINIAYVGSCTYVKGWDVWKDLVKSLPDQICDCYNFWVFGNPKGKYKHMKLVHVNATNDINAMTDSLRRYNIDVVFLGSLCPIFQ